MQDRVRYSLRYRFPKFHFGKYTSLFLLDHIHPRLYFDNWSIQPFNGQAIRWATIVKISQQLEPHIAIETGTFLGSSTPYLSALASDRVFTIEINSDTCAITSARFSENHPEKSNTLINGDSASEIRGLLREFDPKVTRLIVYLDAHWLDEIPTNSEIQALLDWGGVWVAIIDDFKVEKDPGYGFDSYGETIIGFDIVPKSKSLSVFVPSVSSEKETGARRGTGYIFSSSALELVNPKTIMELQVLTE